jgi:SNF2 family DNA or RNA helicase
LLASHEHIGSWLALSKAKYGEKAHVLRHKATIWPDVDAYGADDDEEDCVDSIRLFKEDRDYIYVPRQAGFVPSKVLRRAENRTCIGSARDFGDLITLREGVQSDLVPTYLDGLNQYPYGGLLCAKPGEGKTVMSLRLAQELGRTAVILVHKEFLMDQWTERINQFIPSATVGYVRQKRCDYGKDVDIVIGMIQSLSQRRYREDFYNWAGTVITDEVHRVGAPTWANVIAQFPAAVRIGVTATPRRKDRAEPVFLWRS